MTYLLSQLIGLAALTQAGSITPDGGSITGFMGTSQFSSEVFSITSTGFIKATISSGSGSGRLVSEMSLVTSKGKIDTLLTETGVMKISVKLTDGKLSRSVFGGTPVDQAAPEGAYLLSTIAFSPLQILQTAYDAQKGGPQKFPVYLMEAGVVTQATMNSLGVENIETVAGAIRTDKYSIEASGVAIEWNSVGPRVVMVRPTTGTFRAYRGGYEPPKPVATIVPAPMANKYTLKNVGLMAYQMVLLSDVLMPKIPGKRPAVLLITGMGKQDRYGNTTSDTRSFLYAYLGDRLAADGFVVLRADDRGDNTTLDQIRLDYQVQLDYMQSEPNVNPRQIFLIGIDEGGTVAQMIARDNKWIAGVVLLNTPSESLDKVMIESTKLQAGNQDLPKEARDAAKQKQIVLEKAIKDAKAGSVSAAGMNGDWLRQHMELKPADLAKQVKCPVLIVQAGKDMQVAPRHAERLAKLFADAKNENVTVVTLPFLAHDFTQYPYGNPKYDAKNPIALDAGLLDDVAKWLAAQVPSADNSGN